MIDGEGIVTGEPVVDVAEAGVPVGEISAPEEAHAEEIEVTIGEQPAPNAEEQHAPEWVKNVRKRNRELERELRDVRRKFQESAPAKEPELGAKPKLQDHDYDTDKYESALASWFERKKAADERAAKARQAEESQASEWQARIAAYGAGKTRFKASEFGEAEAVVTDLLDTTQQGIIVNGAEDPSAMVYALGKNEDKARELAAIKDPVRFAFAIAKLEGQLKVSTRKPSAAPERVVSGDSRPSGAIDNTLERLREEAAKTGNFDKVLAYKRAKRA